MIRLTADLPYPLVIKPRKSSGSRGIIKVERPGDLVQAYKQIHALYPFPLIQEFIPTGPRYDVAMLFNKANQVRASFVQKEIRHFPLERGPSTLSFEPICQFSGLLALEV